MAQVDQACRELRQSAERALAAIEQYGNRVSQGVIDTHDDLVDLDREMDNTYPDWSA